MIRTDAEYREVLRRIEQDRVVAEAQRKALEEQGFSPEQVARGMAPLLSFHAQLVEEVRWYEDARAGRVQPVHSLAHIGRLLIGQRIASGLSQRELADRLQVTEAQVSRDENNEYHGISVDRAQRILDAMNRTVTAAIGEPPDVLVA